MEKQRDCGDEKGLNTPSSEAEAEFDIIDVIDSNKLAEDGRLADDQECIKRALQACDRCEKGDVKGGLKVIRCAIRKVSWKQDDDQCVRNRHGLRDRSRKNSRLPKDAGRANLDFEGLAHVTDIPSKSRKSWHPGGFSELKQRLTFVLETGARPELCGNGKCGIALAGWRGHMINSLIKMIRLLENKKTRDEGPCSIEERYALGQMIIEFGELSKDIALGMDSFLDGKVPGDIKDLLQKLGRFRQILKDKPRNVTLPLTHGLVWVWSLLWGDNDGCRVLTGLLRLLLAAVLKTNVRELVDSLHACLKDSSANIKLILQHVGFSNSLFMTVFKPDGEEQLANKKKQEEENVEQCEQKLVISEEVFNCFLEGYETLKRLLQSGKRDEKVRFAICKHADDNQQHSIWQGLKKELDCSSGETDFVIPGDQVRKLDNLKDSWDQLQSSEKKSLLSKEECENDFQAFRQIWQKYKMSVWGPIQKMKKAREQLEVVTRLYLGVEAAKQWVEKNVNVVIHSKEPKELHMPQVHATISKTLICMLHQAEVIWYLQCTPVSEASRATQRTSAMKFAVGRFGQLAAFLRSPRSAGLLSQSLLRTMLARCQKLQHQVLEFDEKTLPGLTDDVLTWVIDLRCLLFIAEGMKYVYVLDGAGNERFAQKRQPDSSEQYLFHQTLWAWNRVGLYNEVIERYVNAQQHVQCVDLEVSVDTHWQASFAYRNLKRYKDAIECLKEGICEAGKMDTATYAHAHQMFSLVSDLSILYTQLDRFDDAINCKPSPRVMRFMDDVANAKVELTFAQNMYLSGRCALSVLFLEKWYIMFADILKISGVGSPVMFVSGVGSLNEDYIRAGRLSDCIACTALLREYASEKKNELCVVKGERAEESMSIAKFSGYDMEIAHMLLFSDDRAAGLKRMLDGLRKYKNEQKFPAHFHSSVMDRCENILCTLLNTDVNNAGALTFSIIDSVERGGNFKEFAEHVLFLKRTMKEKSLSPVHCMTGEEFLFDFFAMQTVCLSSMFVETTGETDFQRCIAMLMGLSFLLPTFLAHDYKLVAALGNDADVENWLNNADLSLERMMTWLKQHWTSLKKSDAGRFKDLMLSTKVGSNRNVSSMMMLKQEIVNWKLFQEKYDQYETLMDLPEKIIDRIRSETKHITETASASDIPCFVNTLCTNMFSVYRQRISIEQVFEWSSVDLAKVCCKSYPL